MSETKQQAGNQLTTEQLEKIGGGDLCNYPEMITIIDGLTRAYEGLIGFTSYVIERVTNGATK